MSCLFWNETLYTKTIKECWYIWSCEEVSCQTLGNLNRFWQFCKGELGARIIQKWYFFLDVTPPFIVNSQLSLNVFMPNDDLGIGLNPMFFPKKFRLTGWFRLDVQGNDAMGPGLFERPWCPLEGWSNPSVIIHRWMRRVHKFWPRGTSVGNNPAKREMAVEVSVIVLKVTREWLE